MDLQQIVTNHLDKIVKEWLQKGVLQEGQLIVVGCSTSEVIGESIGTAGSEQIAEIIYKHLHYLAEQTKTNLAFQCCEHLNRALVVERRVMERFMLTEVSVVPTPQAGGAMASYAYQHLDGAVVVEEVQAHAGIDIGQTMIGMHLRPVVVPVRFQQKRIHHAIVTGATTRPKLIGGSRAVYK